MPPTEARIRTSRWDNDEWLTLPIDCQWLLDMLASQKTTNHAGVGVIPRRMWGNLAADGDAADRIGAAVKICIDRRFLFLDDDTDEFLIRSYIRREILEGPPGMFVAAMACARATRSPRLRAVLRAELLRFDAVAIEHRKRGKASEWPIDAFRRTLEALSPAPDPPGAGSTADEPAVDPVGGAGPDPVADPLAAGPIRPGDPVRPVDKHGTPNAMRCGISVGMADATGHGTGHATGAGVGVGAFCSPGSSSRGDARAPAPAQAPSRTRARPADHDQMALATLTVHDGGGASGASGAAPRRGRVGALRDRALRLRDHHLGQPVPVRQHCRRHQAVPVGQDVGDCRFCADHRHRFERWLGQRAAAEQARRLAFRAAVDVCPDCRGHPDPTCTCAADLRYRLDDPSTARAAAASAAATTAATAGEVLPPPGRRRTG